MSSYNLSPEDMSRVKILIAKIKEHLSIEHYAELTEDELEEDYPPINLQNIAVRMLWEELQIEALRAECWALLSDFPADKQKVGKQALSDIAGLADERLRLEAYRKHLQQEQRIDSWIEDALGNDEEQADE